MTAVEPEYVEDRIPCPACGHPNPPSEKRCGMCPYDARRPYAATPERPLRRHLDDRTTPAGGHAENQASRVDWPIAGCISPTRR